MNMDGRCLSYGQQSWEWINHGLYSILMSKLYRGQLFHSGIKPGGKYQFNERTKNIRRLFGTQLNGQKINEKQE
jgi:hypothetical protein